MNAAGAVLQVRDLHKRFSSAGGDLTILSGVDLDLSRGDALAVIGPSGAGKSTLLYILGLLDTPTSGEVRILSEQPHVWPAAKQAEFRNRSIGFVFQDHHLLPQCTVLENVLLPTLVGSGADQAAVDRATALLTRVGLAHRLDHRPAQLSGGERQRAAVCRALINQPTLLLADEPTGNLDRASAEAVGSLLLELNQERQTVLICVTHSLELAGRFPERRELRDGQLTRQ